MSHAQNLRDLLLPLGVYHWEGSFQWREMQSAGAALDSVAAELETIRREMTLATAEGEGLAALCGLLAHPPAEGEPSLLRQALAALLRIGGDSFTLAAMNDTLSGCGIPAGVEETEDPLTVAVSFPGARGIPDRFDSLRAIIEEILPCHLGVEYRFRFLFWYELEAQFLRWRDIEDAGLSWTELEKQIME